MSHLYCYDSSVETINRSRERHAVSRNDGLIDRDESQQTPYQPLGSLSQIRGFGVLPNAPLHPESKPSGAGMTGGSYYLSELIAPV